jgi:hypothetical protein
MNSFHNGFISQRGTPTKGQKAKWLQLKSNAVQRQRASGSN